MNSYVVSTCILKEASEDKLICTGILNKIVDHSTPYKAVVDKKGMLLELYKTTINSFNNYEIAIWIKHLTTKPEQLDYIDVDFDKKNYTSEIMYFIETASKIKNKKQLIVASHNSIPDGIKYNDAENIIKYKETEITVLNKSEAISLFNLNHKTTNQSAEYMNTAKNSAPQNSNKKYLKIIIYLLPFLVGGGFGYKYWPRPNNSNNNCATITIIGEIDNINQRKIKSVSIEDQTYAEDRTVVSGKFEFKNVLPLNSTQITLVIKYENNTKDTRIVVPFQGLSTDKNCILDLGRRN